MCRSIYVPPSGGSLEIGNVLIPTFDRDLNNSSPFGGIPRNWKHLLPLLDDTNLLKVPPSGGSLEIGNSYLSRQPGVSVEYVVPPSGGSLEIGNTSRAIVLSAGIRYACSPFGGIPRNWKLRRTPGSWQHTAWFPLRGDP